MKIYIPLQRSYLGNRMLGLRFRRAVGLGMAVSFAVMAVTGLTRFSELQALFGINYGELAMVLPIYEIRLLHDWVGLLFLVLMAIHMFINRGWLASAVKSLVPRGNAGGEEERK